MTQPSKTTPDKVLEICSVHVGEGLYGLPITHVLEILGSARPERVPLGPDFVAGLIPYRGDVLTAVSLRRLLGLAPREDAQHLLVMEGDGASFGLLVDAVGEVLTVDGATFEPNPPTMAMDRQQLIAGAYKLDTGLLVMLNPEHLAPMYLARAS